MKRAILLPPMLLAMTGAVAAPVSAASQPFAIGHFSTIRLEAPIDVQVATGKGVSARADGDRDTLDRLELDVNGDMLTVRLGAPRLSSGRTPAMGRAVLRLSTDRVSRAILTGAGTLSIDRMQGLSATVSVRGAGTLRVDSVALDELTAGIVGEGRVALSGKALTAHMDVKGAGALDAGALTVGTLKLGLAGPGSANVAAETAADVVAAGAGDVTVTGQAACKVTHVGTGQVTCGGKSY